MSIKDLLMEAVEAYLEELRFNMSNGIYGEGEDEFAMEIEEKIEDLEEVIVALEKYEVPK